MEVDQPTARMPEVDPFVGLASVLPVPQTQASDSGSRTQCPSASDSVFSVHLPEAAPEVVVRHTLANFPYVLMEGPRLMIERLLARFPSTFTARCIQPIPGMMACRLLGLAMVLDEILSTPYCP